MRTNALHTFSVLIWGNYLTRGFALRAHPGLYSFALSGLSLYSSWFSDVRRNVCTKQKQTHIVGELYSQTCDKKIPGKPGETENRGLAYFLPFFFFLPLSEGCSSA